MKKHYAVKFQLQNAPVDRWHYSLSAAYRDLDHCINVARRSHDCQAICLVSSDGSIVPSRPNLACTAS